MNSYSESWLLGLQHLKEYIDTFGNTNINNRYVSPDGYKLGGWLYRQRRQSKEGKLSSERASMLYDAGYDLELYVNSLLDLKWAVGIRHLKEYINTYGNAHVKFVYISPDGYRLGKWLCRQRKLKKEGLLSSKRVAMLYEAGYDFECFTKTTWKNNWPDGIQHLSEYILSYGSAYVSQYYVCEDGFPLGKWVIAIRDSFDKGTFPIDKIEELFDIGYDITKPTPYSHNPVSWTKGIQHLKEWVNTYGNTCIPYEYVSPDGFFLGAWIHRQKLAFLHGSLSDWKKEELYRTGYNFSTVKRKRPTTTWESGYSHLLEYVEFFGNAMVPYNYLSPDGFKLGYWVIQTRLHHKSLSLSHVKELEALGFIWKTRN